MKGKLTTRKFDITALAHEAMDAHISTLSGVNRERANKIRLLRERGDVFTERLEKTMRKIAKYDQNIKDVRKAITEQKQLRKKLGGGENASQQLRAQVDKRMGHMEKRLNRAIQRHNEVESKHSSLKAKINRMRRDKLMYREVYKKLEAKLEVKQKQMAVMIDKSNEIYNRREQTIKMIAALEKQAQDDQREFTKEWNELGKLIESEKEMIEFMNSATQKREDKRKELQDLDDQLARGELSVEEEQDLKNRVMSLRAQVAGDKARLSVVKSKVATYEDAFEKLKEVTGIGTTEELVESFLNTEDENFALFKYVQNLNKEIEKVEDSMQQLRDEMERYKKGQGAMDSTRKKILDDLEGKVGRTDSKNRVYLEKNQRLMQSFDHLCSAVDIVFKQIGCDKMMAFQEHQEDKAAEVAQSMLWPSDANSEAASEAESAEPPRSPLTGGGSSMHKAHSVLELLGALGVNEMNIMQYLGIIEQRTNELIQSYKQKMALRDGKNVTQAGPSVAMGTTAYQISVPAVGDTTSADRQDIMYDAQGRVIEEGEGGPRPMSMEQLKEQAVRDLERFGQRKEKPQRRGSDEDTKGKRKIHTFQGVVYV